MNRKIVFLDVETVHLTPGPATIWELALIIRDPAEPREPDREIAWHMRPDVSLADAGALRLNGYYQRCKAQARPAGGGRVIHDSGEEFPEDTPLALEGFEIARHIAQILAGQDVTIVGANAGSFDVPHIDAYLRANGECLAADYHYLDIGSLVLGWAHGSGTEAGPWPLKLNTVLRACGLDPDSYSAHQALDDARAVRDIWNVVTGWAGR